MAQAKFTLYKRVKINGEWRYFRAAVAGNNKVKPHIVLVGGQEEIGTKVDPLLKSLHNDPRYAAFLKKLNLPT